jgi:lactate permease
MVIIAGSVMASLQVLMARLGAPQIASSVPAIFGMVTIALITRTPLFKKEESVNLPDDATDDARGPMSFWLAFLPYMLLIALSVISQVGLVKDSVKDIMIALDYPGFETAKGFSVAAALNYAPVRILNHPAPLIIISVLLSSLAIARAGRWKPGAAWQAATLTYNQTRATTLGVSLRVMMGLLQVETARALEIGPVTIASIQSIGASVGSTMAPTKVLVAAAVVGLAGQEDQIFRKVTVAVLALVALTGVEAMILVTLFENWTR